MQKTTLEVVELLKNKNLWDDKTIVEKLMEIKKEVMGLQIIRVMHYSH